MDINNPNPKRLETTEWIAQTRKEINKYCAMILDTRETLESVHTNVTLTPKHKKQVAARIKEMRKCNAGFLRIKDEIKLYIKS